MIAIADVVSGRAGLEGLRWMLLCGLPRRTLGRELKGLLPAANLLGPCRLRHASLRPASRVKAYYDVCVRCDGAGKYAVRPIAVKWKLHGRASAAGLAEMQAEAARQGVAAPFKRLVADVPELNMRVQISPLDPRFPQLVRLSNPELLSEMIAQVCAASDTPPKQIPAGRYVVSQVRYFPGRRHVLRYDRADGNGLRTFFAKPYPGETGREAFRLGRNIETWLASRLKDATSLHPLAYLPEEAAVLYPEVSGVALSKHMRRPDPGLARWLVGAGVALSALHQVPQALSGPMASYDFSAEISDTTKASSHVPVLLPRVGSAIQALLDQGHELSEKLLAEPACFTYGDFKSEHVWVGGSGMTLIDFDNCRWAEPACDIGKFLADLRFWFAAYNQPGLEEAQARFLDGYARRWSPERLGRARLYEAVELVRMAVLRVPLCDDHWASRTEDLTGRAQAVMNQVQVSHGSAANRHVVLSTHSVRAVPGARLPRRGGGV